MDRWLAFWNRRRRPWEPGSNLIAVWFVTVVARYAWPDVPEVVGLYALLALIVFLWAVSNYIRRGWRRLVLREARRIAGDRES